MDEAAAIAIRAAERTVEQLQEVTASVDRLTRQVLDHGDRLARVEPLVASAAQKATTTAQGLGHIASQLDAVLASLRKEAAERLAQLVKTVEEATRLRASDAACHAAEIREADLIRETQAKTHDTLWERLIEEVRRARGALWAEQHKVRFLNRWFWPPVMVAVASAFIVTAGRTMEHLPSQFALLPTFVLGGGVAWLATSVAGKVERDGGRRRG